MDRGGGTMDPSEGTEKHAVFFEQGRAACYTHI